MTDELIEQVARAADEYLGAQCGMMLRKHALDGLAKAAIAAMQPHIEAQREDAARMALEAAATVAPSKTAADECETVGQWTRRTLREAIRAIPTAQFRRTADQPKENTDATSD